MTSQLEELQRVVRISDQVSNKSKDSSRDAELVVLSYEFHHSLVWPLGVQDRYEALFSHISPGEHDL